MKVRVLALIAVGALAGGPLGFFYGNSVARASCENPNAGNLCGLTSATTLPLYVIIGAVIGASFAAVAAVAIASRR